MGREARRRHEVQLELEAELARWARRGLPALEGGAALPDESADVPPAARRVLTRLLPNTLKRAAVAIPIPAEDQMRLGLEASRRGITPTAALLAAARLGAAAAAD